ncbi:MAG: hypothetical protein K2X55_23695 [Burkholderiaceae bacterium]|nr:hypothetical protein [Burkholderiaceae bacterium]
MKNAKPPRDVVVKTLLSPDEFLDFRDVCAASDVSHSAALREMVKGLVDKFRANGKAQSARKEWPGAGQKLAMFAPAPRAVFAGVPRMHLRL